MLPHVNALSTTKANASVSFFLMLIAKTTETVVLAINISGVTLINDFGLYSLILSSGFSSAKQFKRWVTGEVFPSFRKYVAYMLDSVLEEVASSQEFAFELLKKLQAEKGRTAALRNKLEAIAPKAMYCDLALQSKKAIPASLIAKDYGITAVAFNLLLYALHIQYKTGGTWLL